jgi:hypothetical protein
MMKQDVMYLLIAEIPDEVADQVRRADEESRAGEGL